MLIDTPLLIVGSGLAGLVTAKLVSGFGLASLVAGHELGAPDQPVELSDATIAALTPHGVIDVFRPYFWATEPPTISAAAFEEVLKHHCVVDMNITVYDAMVFVDRTTTDTGVSGVLTDGRSRWNVRADELFDTASDDRNPSIVDLNEAVATGARRAQEIVAALR